MTASRQKVSLLEERLARLRLECGATMHDAVRGFVTRIRSRRAWDEATYPEGTEKQLYAQFAHILLADPSLMIPELFSLLPTTPHLTKRIASLRSDVTVALVGWVLTFCPAAQEVAVSPMLHFS